MGFDLLFFVMFSLIFILFICVFAAVFVKAIRQWNRNNHAPRLSVTSTIVAKRTDVSHHHHHNGSVPHTTHSSTYYVTFQVESGDRLELQVSGMEYGMLVEGDYGKLTFQGTRYLNFERT